MAFSRLCRDGRKLLPDDVLHYGSRVDALLFLSDAHRAFRWGRCGSRGADFPRHACKTRSNGRADVFGGSGWLWHLLRRAAKRRGTHYESDDGGASGNYGIVSRTQPDNERRDGRHCLLPETGFWQDDGSRNR